MSVDGVTYVASATVPPAGVAAFRAYESAVLPLLADHGGRLERRLRSADGLREIHVLWFPRVAALDAYRADRRRQEHSHLLAESGAHVEVLPVTDVPAAESSPVA
jgi:hypothetical protein